MFDFTPAMADSSGAMIAYTLESILGIGGLLGFLFLLACAILGIAAIIMPIVVLIMHRQLDQVARTLAAMEWMMRNGKE